MNWQKLYNPPVLWLLHSPLHRLADQQTIAITVTGRKSGKRYTFPVSYIRDGETLLVISQKERTWWKNLHNGAPVTVLLQGRELQARGETFTDTALAATILLWILQQVLAHQRLLHVKLDVTGQPEQPEALTRLAQDHVVVRLESRICHERPAINLGSLQQFPVETQEVAPLLFPAVCTLGHLLRLPCHAPERVLIS